MSLFAGVCETNITPPIGVWLSGYANRPTGAVGVHDDLFARALVLDNGECRLAVLSIDLISLTPEVVIAVREGISERLGIPVSAIMLNCSHTHGGPSLRGFRGMGNRDEVYVDILIRKLIGAAKQAADEMVPAQLSYGESTVQIGISRRERTSTNEITIGRNYGGPVAPLVQTLSINGTDGRTFALLFSHACHPTTMEGDNLHITADWPGAAVAHLKNRFHSETKETGIAPNALPMFLQGCCGDINPNRRSTWEAVDYAGRLVADAAHTARWNAHGRMEDTLSGREITVKLPMRPPPPLEECMKELALWESKLAEEIALGVSQGRINFLEGCINWARDASAYASNPDFSEFQEITIQCLNLGGLKLIGFPAEMFVKYQLDFIRQNGTPVIAMGYTNGCWNYAPTAIEFTRGGYEVDGAQRYYGTLGFASDCESILRTAAYDLLEIDNPDTTPYTLN